MKRFRIHLPLTSDSTLFSSSSCSCSCASACASSFLSCSSNSFLSFSCPTSDIFIWSPIHLEALSSVYVFIVCLIHNGAPLILIFNAWGRNSRFYVLQFVKFCKFHSFILTHNFTIDFDKWK